MLYKECSAEDFVSSDKPADILGGHQTISGKRLLPLCSERRALCVPGAGAAAAVSDTCALRALRAGMYNKLVVSPETEIAEHPATTAEILALVADLRVLGRKEFKQLLKWRQDVRAEDAEAQRRAPSQAHALSAHCLSATPLAVPFHRF